MRRTEADGTVCLVCADLIKQSPASMAKQLLELPEIIYDVPPGGGADTNKPLLKT